MKTILQLRLTRAFRLCGTCFALLAGCFATGLAATHAAPASLQPLLHPGKWPILPPDAARDVTVVGNYAYVVLGLAGLAMIDVSNSSNCVRVGGYNTRGHAVGVAVSGHYAYVADGLVGLQVIDVSDPTNCVLLGGHDTSGYAMGVAMVAGRICVADGDAGLLVLPTLRNVQFTVRVDATPGETFTLEAATDLSAPMPWTPLVTTNVPAMSFDYVDFDVKLTNKPQKYYRVRQP